MTKSFPILRATSLCLAIFCLVTTNTPARVSLSWGAGSQSSKALLTAGGTSVYRSEIDLNGTDARLSVFSFEHAADALVAKLSRLFANASFSFKGGTMAFGLLTEGHLAVRFLVIQLTNESQTLVVKIEQSADDYEKSLKPPEKHLLSQIPEFPGSKPQFYARNKDSDMQLASSSTASTAADVNTFYESLLPAAGWEKPLTNTSSLQLYMKGSAVCMVLCSQPDRTGTSTITLLHKTHGVK